MLFKNIYSLSFVKRINKFFGLILILFLISCTKNNEFSIASLCRDLSVDCVKGKHFVDIYTNKGKIKVLIDADSAPITSSNFLDLVNKGVYNQTAFNRIIKGPRPFVIQIEDPSIVKSTALNESSYLSNYINKKSSSTRFIPLEIKLINEDMPRYGKKIRDTKNLSKIKLKHKKGSISMARLQSLNSASTQFFISLNTLNILDGRYAVFGQIVEGLYVLDLIKEEDYIEKIIHIKENK